MSGEIFISLDEEDFKCLVRAGIITIKDKVCISLKDIGFDIMDIAISSAEDGIDN